jgi:hypothetical protein
MAAIPLAAQTGPGGVGTNSGTSSLKLWYRVDNGVSTTGASVDSWANSAGISALDVTETGTNRPTLATGSNGYNQVTFNGSNRLVTAIGAITTSNFVQNQASTLIVSRASNTTQTSCVYTTDPLENAPGTRFSNHIPWSGTVYYDIGTCCDDRIQVGGLSNLTSYNVWSYDAINTSTGKQLYQNGTQVSTVTEAALTYSGHATQRFNIGGNTSNGEAGGFVGDIAEVIIYTTKLNTAQRYIVQNYLAAKYGIALSANDLFTMDNAANGNYDHDVAGIGRVNASNMQTDSQGTGMVRISGASDLDNNEYLLWGHDLGSITTPNSSDVDGTTVKRRLDRIWRVSETGGDGVGNITMAFDLSSVPGAKTQAALRLLVDRDGDGFSDNDRTPLTGTLSGNVFTVTVSNANLTNGDRFTIGTTDVTTTPLPVGLTSFDLIYEAPAVIATWQTASELNNDYFTLERSGADLAFQEIGRKPGAGTSRILHNYSMIDLNPFEGRSYYRLKQTDFDGTTTYFDVQSIFIAETKKEFLVYPNPNNGKVLHFKWGNSPFHLTRIEVMNQQGETMHSASITSDTDLREYAVELNQFLPAGLYIVKARYNGKDEVLKLVIEK